MLNFSMADLGKVGEEVAGINKEIWMKLDFLGRIQELRRAAGSGEGDRCTLALGLGDRAGQLEVARVLDQAGVAIARLLLALLCLIVCLGPGTAFEMPKPVDR